MESMKLAACYHQSSFNIQAIWIQQSTLFFSPGIHAPGLQEQIVYGQPSQALLHMKNNFCSRWHIGADNPLHHDSWVSHYMKRLNMGFCMGVIGSNLWWWAVLLQSSSNSWTLYYSLSLRLMFCFLHSVIFFYICEKWFCGAAAVLMPADMMTLLQMQTTLVKQGEAHYHCP